MSRQYAKIRLAEWARWNREESSGYPKSSAFFGDVGRSSGYLSDVPIHIALVDVIVRQLEVKPRRVLIVHYTQTGSAREKAMRIEEPWTTYRRLLREGEDTVGIELDYAETYCPVAQQMAYSA